MDVLCLFLILLFICSIAYFYGGKEYFDPFFLLCLVFLFSTSFLFFNINKWGISLHFNSCGTILISILCFGFGDFLAKKINLLSRNREMKGTSNLSCSYSFDPLEVNPIIILLIAIFMLGTCVLYFKEIKNISSIAGNRSGAIGDCIYYARQAQLYLGANINGFVQKLYLSCKIITYIFTFIFTFNIIVDKVKVRYFGYLLPVLFWFILIYLSGGRMSYIHFFTYFLLEYGIVMKRINGNSFMQKKKIRNIAIRVVIIFFVLFIFMGLTARKSTASIFDTLSVYCASGINALDVFLQGKIPVNQIFGQETLITVYQALQKFGVHVPKNLLSSPREFVNMNLVSTNIYTAFRRYIVDYGFLGCFFVMFLLGFFYAYFYKRVKRPTNSFFPLIVYASIFYPVIEMPIDERFFLKLFSISEIYELLGLFILYQIFIRKNLKRKDTNQSL